MVRSLAPRLSRRASDAAAEVPCQTQLYIAGGGGPIRSVHHKFTVLPQANRYLSRSEASEDVVIRIAASLTNRRAWSSGTNHRASLRPASVSFRPRAC